MTTMNEKELERLIQSIDTPVTPPEGLKEKILSGVMARQKKERVLTPAERFFFESPLRAACIIAIPLSGALWAALGGGYASLLRGIVGW